MLETAELGLVVDKETYNREAPLIRTGLLEAQKELAGSGMSVVILVSGVEGAGKSETVNLLLEWMDARGTQTHALWEITEEEKTRPPLWRFWRVLPPRGRLAILFGSWYTLPIIDRVFKRLGRAEFERSLDRILELEEMLHQENILIVKFWMHLSPEAQKARLKALRRDPKQKWRVTKLDKDFFEHVHDFRRVSEAALQKTNTAHAPWHLVDATDVRYRNLSVAKTLLHALRQRLQALKSSPTSLPIESVERPLGQTNVLRQLDLNAHLDTVAYAKRIPQLQEQVGCLSRLLRKRQRSLILVFEGPDAAGKGGVIRRFTAAMDARDYQVICVGAPTDEENARPYLWRFWRHLPRPGRVTIYDRSWYGRVLVERIEGFCAVADWQRAYAEIRAFEEQLTEFGIIVLKFWLAISPEEQLRRFQNRHSTPYKQYKLTDEDWRNREKWDAYEAAACDMIEKTSSPDAPWTIVEAEIKEWARVKVLHNVVERLERELGE